MPFVAAAHKSIDALTKIESDLYSLAAAYTRIGLSKSANELKEMADNIDVEVKRLQNAVIAKVDEDTRLATASTRNILEAVTTGIAIGGAAASKDNDNKT